MEIGETDYSQYAKPMFFQPLPISEEQVVDTTQIQITEPESDKIYSEKIELGQQTEPQPAGWYHVSEKVLERYWDGSQWTNQWRNTHTKQLFRNLFKNK